MCSVQHQLQIQGCPTIGEGKWTVRQTLHSLSNNNLVTDWTGCEDFYGIDSIELIGKAQKMKMSKYKIQTQDCSKTNAKLR